jgi:general secretion pathway protein B
MSSILKSLRKIEEEKRGAVRAAPDLRVDQGFVPAKSKQLLPLLTGLALGAVIVGLFFLWAPRSTAPVVKDQPQTKANEVVSAVKQDPKTSGDGQAERVVAPAKKEQKPDASIVVSDSANTIQTPPVVMVATAAPMVYPELPEGVSLLVTEIFFQEDSAGSMAVVNDLPVMVGTHVDSAVVTGIQPDRVLFKLNGKIYTIAIPKR